MNRTRLSPLDILGITLGVIVILVVIGSVVAISRGQLFNAPAGVVNGESWWDGGISITGGGMKAEADEQIPAGNYTAVEFRNVAGSIDISGTTAGGITVHSTKSAMTQAGLDGVHVAIERQGDRLVVQEKHDPGVFRNLGTVSYRVTIPAGVKVVEAHSVSGSIDVTGLGAGVDQVLATISGSVSTDGARNLDISSTSGHVGFSSSGSALSARTVSGSIDGVIAGLGPTGSARLSSVSGSITVNAYAGLAAEVSLHSVSGSVSCDFPLTVSEQRRNRLTGRIGAGTATFDVGTVSGSITINKE